jgi:hypothetical protein
MNEIPFFGTYRTQSYALKWSFVGGGAFYAQEQGSDTFFQVTQRVAGSIVLSSRTAIFPMIDELMFK